MNHPWTTISSLFSWACTYQFGRVGVRKYVHAAGVSSGSESSASHSSVSSSLGSVYEPTHIFKHGSITTSLPAWRVEMQSELDLDPSDITGVLLGEDCILLVYKVSPA